MRSKKKISGLKGHIFVNTNFLTVVGGGISNVKVGNNIGMVG